MWVVGWALLPRCPGLHLTARIGPLRQACGRCHERHLQPQPPPPRTNARARARHAFASAHVAQRTTSHHIATIKSRWRHTPHRLPSSSLPATPPSPLQVKQRRLSPSSRLWVLGVDNLLVRAVDAHTQARGVGVWGFTG